VNILSHTARQDLYAAERVDFTRMLMVKKNSNNKKQKAKHGLVLVYLRFMCIL
jgi:hypothetical protein